MGNEELQSKKRAIEFYDSGKINVFEVGTTEGLKQKTRSTKATLLDRVTMLLSISLLTNS
jgi:hypothetical protein